MSLYPREVTQRQVGDPDQLAAGWVGGAKPPDQPIVIVEPDAAWPAEFAIAADRVRSLLGDTALRIEHVGSTSVPGLPAKPIIDIDLHVADTAAEDAYVPVLEKEGYRLVLREPWWNGHRMLVGPNGRVNLHVFPADAPSRCDICSSATGCGSIRMTATGTQRPNASSRAQRRKTRRSITSPRTP